MPRNGSRNFITEEKPSSYNDTLDQSALPNLNSNWVNYKGAWIIHIIIIFCIKIVFSSIPKVSPEASWTFTNLSYMFGSFIMFHWVKGVPFDFNSGAYDGLTLWEQIDNGAQYTPAKKYLTAVPIVFDQIPFAPCNVNGGRKTIDGNDANKNFQSNAHFPPIRNPFVMKSNTGMRVMAPSGGVR
ncbi:1942_t:CDS:2 [Entrophospora sp. SA101]|nr:1942_t:CDS:2 [Entrophospora sp. SA101]